MFQYLLRYKYLLKDFYRMIIEDLLIGVQFRLWNILAIKKLIDWLIE